MKKIIIVMLIITGCFSAAAKKSDKSIEIPDMEAQMERAGKVESYKAKKDVAWHKTEYNKVLKHLNKSRK